MKKKKIDIESVDHPHHYVYEIYRVLEEWGLIGDAYLFNVMKYIVRAGKKDGSDFLEDLKKAQWYLNRRIEKEEGK